MRHVYMLWEVHEHRKVLLDVYSTQKKAEKAKRARENLPNVSAAVWWYEVEERVLK